MTNNTGHFVPTCFEERIFPYRDPIPVNVGRGRLYVTYPGSPGTSATFTAFDSGGYSRRCESAATVEYLPNGSTSIKGICHEPKYVWDIKAFCTEHDYRIFQTLTYRQDYERRKTRDDFEIYLDDLIQPITEKSVTRALVAGTTSITFAQVVNYYARFPVYIPLNEIEPVEFVGAGLKVAFKAYEM